MLNATVGVAAPPIIHGMLGSPISQSLQGRRERSAGRSSIQISDGDTKRCAKKHSGLIVENRANYPQLLTFGCSVRTRLRLKQISQQAVETKKLQLVYRGTIRAISHDYIISSRISFLPIVPLGRSRNLVYGHRVPSEASMNVVDSCGRRKSLLMGRQVWVHGITRGCAPRRVVTGFYEASRRKCAVVLSTADWLIPTR